VYLVIHIQKRARQYGNTKKVIKIQFDLILFLCRIWLPSAARNWYKSLYRSRFGTSSGKDTASGCKAAIDMGHHTGVDLDLLAKDTILGLR
jgi:hypothetical protein